jgi:hypothetical protein
MNAHASGKFEETRAAAPLATQSNAGSKKKISREQRKAAREREREVLLTE